jgi:hypothetical protein
VHGRTQLRSFSYDPARRFTSDDLGIAAEPQFPAGYADQLRKPFRWHRDGASDDRVLEATPVGWSPVQRFNLRAGAQARSQRSPRVA